MGRDEHGTMLNQLMLRLEYRSDEVLIGGDFYEKCLPLSMRFDRAVGFFASSVFAACPEAFHRFFENRGRMRVVCCPILDRADIDAIYRGYRDRPEVVRTARLAILAHGRRETLQRRSELTSWLVASGSVEIRIARREPGYGNHIYHEKLGLFGDEEDHWVAFAGSANESLSGLEGNFESVDVFRSWLPTERKRVDQKRSSFDRLWANETEGVEVLAFAEAATRGYLKARVKPEVEGEATGSPEGQTAVADVGPLPGIEEILLLPGAVRLKEHQKDAVRKWFGAKGRGVFAMATGSGKTIAALAAASKFYEWANAPVLVVIVCPYLHLCVQWIEEARRFGLDPLLCAMERSAWYEPLSTRLYNLASGTRRVASVVVSNATFATPAFQSLLRRAPARSLIVGDEVHNLGAPDLRAALPQNIGFRLGLSATPQRHRDLVGTQAIRDYFGEPVIEYSLRQALDDDVLCPYRYVPILVPLTDDELDEYLALTRRIAQLMNASSAGEGSPALDALLLQRARLLGTARGKIPALISLLSPLRETTHNLIYCGDGSVESEPDASILRHIDAVVRALGRDLEMAVAKYVADTPLTRRHLLRRRFAEGDLQGLVAIRCLDEGVDVPETRRAFILASSTNPRQFIQRRGRILRRSPGKTMAEIYDFIVEPSEEEIDPSNPIFPTARSLFRRELGRIWEFAGLAVNGPEALRTLLPLRDKLNLLDFGGDDGEGEGEKTG
jgi:DNA phosphorothioation system restriction enzyme